MGLSSLILAIFSCSFCDISRPKGAFGLRKAGEAWNPSFAEPKAWTGALVRGVAWLLHGVCEPPHFRTKGPREEEIEERIEGKRQRAKLQAIERGLEIAGEAPSIVRNLWSVASIPRRNSLARTTRA
ncbi:hypothetical protein VNO77_07625 [Canavalia gladiata]|uniref:Uncharacterized protein n=1 Tax=Canavalia gladiata TaxID=3824 RepID=A0AAN9MDG0_CANGL